VPARYGTNADADDNENNARDYAASSLSEEHAGMKPQQRQQASNGRGNPQNDGKRESYTYRFNGKTEKDLRDSPARTESCGEQDRTVTSVAIDVNEVRNRDKGDDRGQKHQREDGPREPGVLPGPIASEFHGQGEAGIHDPSDQQEKQPYGCIRHAKSHSCLPT
jgi:hypothetical protein